MSVTTSKKRYNIPLHTSASGAHIMLQKDIFEQMTDPKTTQATQNFEHFTVKMAIELAAPHTWPAAILPVLIATCCAAANGSPLSAVMVCILLVICILMQASVNTFNDYYDYVKGSDSKDDDVDPTDAVLVYNNVNPKSALRLAVGLLVVAFMLGAYVIYQAGLIPLVLGIIGAAIVVLYSAGKTPISYLPIGEAVSGIVMGGLIPLACYQALTGTLDFFVLLWSIPTIIGIGLIMMTNNTCDIEKDIEAARHTLPTKLGRKNARKLYHALVYVWVAAIALIIVLRFPGGTIVLPFGILASYPLLKALLKNPLAPMTRVGAMGQICSVNIALGAFYAASILASSAISLTV